MVVLFLSFSSGTVHLRVVIIPMWIGAPVLFPSVRIRLVCWKTAAFPNWPPVPSRGSLGFRSINDGKTEVIRQNLEIWYSSTGIAAEKLTMLELWSR